jgi:hypothetical protein
LDAKAFVASATSLVLAVDALYPPQLPGVRCALGG